MLRNGIVSHPSLWQHGVYNEIQNPPERYSIVDREKLIMYCGVSTDEQLKREHKFWIEDLIRSESKVRQPDWSEAVGSLEFIEKIKAQHNLGSFGRKAQQTDDSYVLRESLVAYNGHLTPENKRLSFENSYLLAINNE